MHEKQFYLTIQTPFGNMVIIYHISPFKLHQILLPSLYGKAQTAFDFPSGNHHKAQEIGDIILRYFDGKPINPPWGKMAMDNLTALQRSVLIAVADIPYGQVRSYKEIAQAVSRPKAYRFVGNTMAGNPFPILIPCHRVVRSNGSIGQFGGGIDMKKKLIALESQIVNLKST